MSITLADVLEAQRTILPWLPATPLFSYAVLTDVSGAALFLNHED